MIDLLVAQLDANCPSFVTIDYALASEPIDSKDDECPAAFCYLESEQAATNSILGLVRQDVTQTVHVFIVAKHADMESLRTEVRDAVIGWTPDNAHEPLQFVSGSTASIRGEWMWWLDVYTTRTEFRA